MPPVAAFMRRGPLWDAGTSLLKGFARHMVAVTNYTSHHVSIHAPYGANLEEVTPLPNEFYPPEGGGFKPGSVFDEAGIEACFRVDMC